MSLRLVNLHSRNKSRKPRIVGWANGCPVWSIAGGAPDDDPSTGGEGSPGSEGNGEKEDDDDDDDKEDEKPKGDLITREEFDKVFARMQAADRAKTEAEKKVKEYENANKSELEREKARADEAEAKLVAATAAVRSQAVRLAFLTSSAGVTWHDPEDALAFAMRDESLKDLEVSEDGTVDKAVVKKVVDGLVKSKPYLVKKADGVGGDDKDSGPSGHHPDGNKDKKSLDKQKLMEKYPALRR